MISGVARPMPSYASAGQALTRPRAVVVDLCCDSGAVGAALVSTRLKGGLRQASGGPSRCARWTREPGCWTPSTAMLTSGRQPPGPSPAPPARPLLSQQHEKSQNPRNGPFGYRDVPDDCDLARGSPWRYDRWMLGWAQPHVGRGPLTNRNAYEEA